MAPAHICCRSRQTAIRQHELRIDALHVDFGVVTNQLHAGLVVRLGSLVRNRGWPSSAGLMIMLMIFAFNLLGDTVREQLDPRLRKLVGSQS